MLFWKTIHTRKKEIAQALIFTLFLQTALYATVSEEDATTRSGSCCTNACKQVPLTISSPVVALVIPGVNYCLTDNASAIIAIGASNVTLDLNGKTLRGIIFLASGASNVSIKNGTIQPAAPNGPNDAAAPAVLIPSDSQNTSLCCLTILCDDSTDVFGLNGINGRSCIVNEGTATVIQDCSMKSGAGAPGQTLVGGIGGAAGNGITSSGSLLNVDGCLIVTGAGGTGGDANSGNCNSRNGGNGGNGGNGIVLRASANNSLVSNCTILTGNGGNGRNGLLCAEGGIGGNSGNGIDQTNAAANSFQFTACTIRTGNGGNGGSSKGNGGKSGYGIVTRGGQITNCLISTGNAGHGGAMSNPGNGGNAGAGIFVINDACRAQMLNNVIERTGFGGDAGNGFGMGGDGGDGIFIDASALNSEARLNTISSTGKGGESVVQKNGKNGRAITDKNPNKTSNNPSCDPANDSARSAIFSNFAFAISNTKRYLLHGDEDQNGTNVVDSTSIYDNVYML